MRFSCYVHMDNAAFDDPLELPRILDGISYRLEQTLTADDRSAWRTVSQTILDVNGNDVGRWKIEDDG